MSQQKSNSPFTNLQISNLLRNKNLGYYFCSTNLYWLINRIRKQYKIEHKLNNLMSKFKINSPSSQICDSMCATPALMNKKFQVSMKNLLQNNGFMMQSQQQFSQGNKKVRFQKLKEKTQFSQSAESESKTQFTLNEIQAANQSQIIKDLKDIKSFLNINNGNFSLKLLYRASQYNFDVKKFHQLCSGVENTLVVAEIKNGHVFGGFSTLQWNDKYDKAGTYFKTDKKQQSFVYNYTTRQKFKLIKQTNNKAIIACKYLGPTFGGYDLSIGNYANKTYSSSCDFPVSYSKQNKERNTKLNRKTLIGVSQQLFLIKEWEVFQVVNGKPSYDQQKLQKIFCSSLKKSQQVTNDANQPFWKGICNFLGKKKK